MLDPSDLKDVAHSSRSECVTSAKSSRRQSVLLETGKQCSSHLNTEAKSAKAPTDFKIKFERDAQSTMTVMKKTLGSHMGSHLLKAPNSHGVNISHPDLDIRGKHGVALSKGNVLSTMKQMLRPAETEFTMKLLGYESGMEREIDRMNKQAKFIVHPCSKFRCGWDCIILVVCCLNMVVIPICVCLYEDYRETWWQTYNAFCDFLFLLDIVINFRTGYITHNDVILDPKLMTKHYLSTWFIPDLVSSVPWDLILRPLWPQSEAGKALRVLRIIKVVSLIRLLRLSRLWRYVLRLESVLGFTGWFMPLFNVFCVIFIVLHWLACFHFLVARLEDFPSDSWVKLNSLEHATTSEVYEYSFFRTMSHMMCIGYGRYTPQGQTDIVMVTISTMIGGLCYTLIIARLVTTYQHLSESGKRRYQEKLNEVEDFMDAKHLPKEMRKKILDYLDHRFQGSIFREEMILLNLNPALRAEILNFTCRNLVSKFPLLKKLETHSMNETVSKLKKEVYQPGDIIYHGGEIADKVYFVEAGTVVLSASDVHEPLYFNCGSYFGEVCLMMRDQPRRFATATSLGYTFLYTLDAEDFYNMLEIHPRIKYAMEVIAAKRAKDMKRDPNLVTTRAELDRELKSIEDAIKRSNSDMSVAEVAEHNQSRRSSAFLQNLTDFFRRDDRRLTRSIHKNNVRRLTGNMFELKSSADQRVTESASHACTSVAPELPRRESLPAVITPKSKLSRADDSYDTSNNYLAKLENSQKNNNSIRDGGLDERVEDLADRIIVLESVTRTVLEKLSLKDISKEIPKKPESSGGQKLTNLSGNTNRIRPVTDHHGMNWMTNINDRRHCSLPSIDVNRPKTPPLDMEVNQLSDCNAPTNNCSADCQYYVYNGKVISKIINRLDSLQEQKQNGNDQEQKRFMRNSAPNLIRAGNPTDLTERISPNNCQVCECRFHGDIEARLDDLTCGQRDLNESVMRLTQSVEQLSQLLATKSEEKEVPVRKI